MQFHIQDLTCCLLKNNWQVVDIKSGNDFDISEFWIISHLYYKNKILTIAFEGLGDLEVLPIEDCYACYLVENKNIDLYFCKNNKKEWQKNLMIFLNMIFNYINES